MNPDWSWRLRPTDAQVDEAWVVMLAMLDDEPAGTQAAGRRGRHRRAARPSRLHRPRWLRVPDWWPTRLLARIADTETCLAENRTAIQALACPWYPGGGLRG